MDIKEIALKVAEESGAVGYSPAPLRAVRGYSFTYEQLQNFAEALIESYKAELLKEVGEPVGYRWRVKGYGDNKSQFCPDWGFTSSRQTVDEDDEPLYTSNQVAAAILKATKPLEERLSWLDYTEKMNKALVVEIEELHAQLAAAQEEGATVTSERDNLWFKLETAKAELADLRDQLAKAEQRVAEACALTYLEDYDLTDIAERVRAGEWRKFVKEM